MFGRVNTPSRENLEHKILDEVNEGYCEMTNLFGHFILKPFRNIFSSNVVLTCDDSPCQV